MNRGEFLEILRGQLSGQMHEGKAAAHVRYYEDYIQSQVRSGRSEEEVLEELGDPRLIAKTLLDTDADAGQGNYEEYSTYTDSSYGTGYNQQDAGVKRTHKLDLSTWYGKLIVIAIAAAVVFLLITIIGAVLPFFVVLAVILFIISQLKKRGGF